MYSKELSEGSWANYRTGELTPDPRSVYTDWSYEDDLRPCDPWVMAQMEAEERRLIEAARTQDNYALDTRKVA